MAIITGVQRNLNAGVYERGPLSPKYEAAVKGFQDMVREEFGARGPVAERRRGVTASFSSRRLHNEILVATQAANSSGTGELAT